MCAQALELEAWRRQKLREETSVSLKLQAAPMRTATSIDDGTGTSQAPAAAGPRRRR